MSTSAHWIYQSSGRRLEINVAADALILKLCGLAQELKELLPFGIRGNLVILGTFNPVLLIYEDSF